MVNAIKETRLTDGYYDESLGLHIVSVMAGHCNWTSSEDVAFSTMLGSCLSVCAYDSDAGVGGMNHFLLPESHQDEDIKFSDSFRYGSAAIESLLNSLYAHGAAKNGLKIKIFGGANVLKNASRDIGEKNVKFTKNFFQRENLRIETEDLGGNVGRRIVFHPASGKVLLKTIGDSQEITQISKNEKKILERVSRNREESDIELF
jgi:chemotaxis protein CheD